MEWALGSAAEERENCQRMMSCISTDNGYGGTLQVVCKRLPCICRE